MQHFFWLVNKYWGMILAAVIALSVILCAGKWACPGDEVVADGETFVVLLDSSPAGLDPRFSTTHASAQLVGLLHEGLISTDTPDGTMEYRLAEEIEQTSPTRYELRLRSDALFHDGVPVTSDDVEYTYMTLPEVRSPLAGTAAHIKRFDIIDEHNFVITLHDVHAPFMNDLSMGILPRHRCEEEPVVTPFPQIVPFHVSSGLCFEPVMSPVERGAGIVPVEGDAPYQGRWAGYTDRLWAPGCSVVYNIQRSNVCPGDPVGAGAFEFVRREGGLYVEFKAFDDYLDGRPHIDRLAFRVIRDDNARILALLGGTADLAQNAVSPMMMPVVEDTPGLQVEGAPSFKYTYLAFNLEDPHLKHQKVRQAIAHAIDRERIIEYKFAGTARLSTGIFVPEHWAYEGDVATYDYDPERARQLLDDAGFLAQEGEPRFELEFKVSANNFRRSLALLIAQQLGEVGIDVRVRAYEWGTFFDDIRSRNFQLTTLQWPSVQEPNLLRWIFHSDNIPTADARAAGANRGAYRNDRVDELLDRGKREPDRERRKEIYAEVQQILAEELPYISLWHEDNVAVLREGVEGYYTTPNAYFDALRTVRPAPTDR